MNALDYLRAILRNAGLACWVVASVLGPCVDWSVPPADDRGSNPRIEFGRPAQVRGGANRGGRVTPAGGPGMIGASPGAAPCHLTPHVPSRPAATPRPTRQRANRRRSPRTPTSTRWSRRTVTPARSASPRRRAIHLWRRWGAGG